ncbi:MAG TPA: pitrilysin family protein, partial [Acidobacteriota bacterium]|nr:pitrilysin family protein [Acidobacteriota bacterium]
MFLLHRASLSAVVVLCLVQLLSAGPSIDDLVNDIDIPFKKYVLKNGLTLIVHEDHKAPIVAVNVWYHVGSKNEKPGKTGFAHLFEHLMFNGSENHDGEYFEPLERVGATDMNGTTNTDRTNYFQNVPKHALDVALWMESDRMGHMLGAVTQEKLDEQRGVVQNEKRQYENQPYGRVYGLITENTYPKGHPYSWQVIGSMEDLNAASLEDVHEWFKTYYGASNAVLTIAGDVDAEEVLKKVEHYFGDIPPGPPIEKQQVWIAKRQGTHRQILQERVPQPRIYKVWNVPEWGSLEADQLDLVASILGSGKTSRLYKRLIYQDQIATSVQAENYAAEIGGQFLIDVMARPGQDLAEVERAIDEELQKFLDEGPSENEVRIAQTEFLSNFVRGAERIGGFGGKSDLLAMNEVYGGRPDYYKVSLQRIRDATPEALKEVAREWLSDGQYVLEVHPFPEYVTLESPADRSKLPEPGEPPTPSFPKFQKAQLPNGLTLITVTRRDVPLVHFELLVNAGFAADRYLEPGTASLAMAMLDEGTTRRTGPEISEELALLGSNLVTTSNLDSSLVLMSTLKTNLAASLDIFADVILNPAFPENEFARLKKEQESQIQREKQTPAQMALRILPRFLYGEQHPYGNPLTGSGTEESLARITLNTLKEFHRTWFKPNNSTLIVVGDTTLEEIKEPVEQLFGQWERGEVPKKDLSALPESGEAKVYLVDRPGSIQSLILGGLLAPPKDNPQE